MRIEHIENIIQRLQAVPRGRTIPELIQDLSTVVTDSNVRFAIRDLLAQGRIKKSGQKRGQHNKADIYLLVDDPKEQKLLAREENARRLARQPSKPVQSTPNLDDTWVLSKDRGVLHRGIKAALTSLQNVEFQPPHQVRLQVETARQHLTRLYEAKP